MSSALPQYSVRTLGEHGISGSPGCADLGTLGLALIVYLALARRQPTRSDLCALLWEQDGPDERHRLRQLLYVIRHRTPGILLEGTHYLDLANVCVDAIECGKAARSGDPIRAVSLYAGHFLQTFSHISRPFDDWQDSAAAEVLQDVRLAAHARLKARNASPSEIVLLASWLKDYDELEATERIRLLSALIELGRRAEAEFELHSLEGVRLSREAQVAVDALAHQLRSPDLVASDTVAAVLPESTRREIASQVSSSFQHPLTVLVGESGVGKSRLLDWIARLAAVRGARVYSHTILATTRPHGAAKLQPLVTLLEGEASAKKHDDVPSLAGALADQIGEDWTLIAVDNVNYADSSTKELIRLLPAMSKSHSIMMVCAVSGDERSEDSAWIESLLPNAAVIFIKPLDDHLTAALLDRLALANDYALTESQRSLIIEQSRGIPRRVIRMAEVIAEGSHRRVGSADSDHFASPRVMTQISGLTDLIQRMLGCIAFSSGELSKKALAAILNQSDEEIECGLKRLVALSLISMSEHHVSAIGPHIPKTLVAVTDAEFQKGIRLALAVYCAGQGDHLAAADYYESAGDRNRSGDEYEAAAASAMQAGRFDVAERAGKAALTRAANPDEYQRRSRLLAAYYARVSRFEEAYPHLLSLSKRSPQEELTLLTGSVSFIDSSSDEKWTEFAERLTTIQSQEVDQAGIARAYLVAFDRAYQFGKEGLILPAFRRFLADRSDSDPRNLAEVLMKSARINQLFGDASRAQGEAESAVEYAEMANDPVVLSNAYDTRALVGFLQGRVQAAFRDFEASERIAASASLYFLRERYYNNLAVLHYEVGDLDGARKLLRTAALFNTHTQLYALSNLAVIEIAAGNYDLARSYGLKLRSTTSTTAPPSS